MSIFIIIGAATLIAAPLEAYKGRNAGRHTSRPNGRRKSPHTFHSTRA